MPRKKTRRPAPSDPPPTQGKPEAGTPAPKSDRVAHFQALRKQYPAVPVQVVRTPILEFLDAAELFQDTMHAHVTAYVNGDRQRMLWLRDEAEVICEWVGGLCLAARQVGYQLTNFDPLEVAKRCESLSAVCADTLRAKSAYQYEETSRVTGWLKCEYDRVARLESTEEREREHARLDEIDRQGAYTFLGQADGPYFSARNAVNELALAVRPELWKKWPFKPPGKTKTETIQADRLKGIPLAEAEVLVREWLATYAKADPFSITRDAVATGAGVSSGQVSKTTAWKAFRERRDAEAKPVAREVPMSDAMQAAVPSSYKRPDELAALIDEQKAEEAEQERRHKRRHERRHGPS